MILESAFAFADDLGVDITAYVPEIEAFIITKALRDEHCPFAVGTFWMLSKSQKANALSLTESAKAGRLAIFIGAGVSIPSGAPSWWLTGSPCR